MLAPAPVPPDLASLGPTPEAIVAAIESEATLTRTPCGSGEMVWRAWGQGEPLVLLHGGYGSWTHWLRNILPFAGTRRVIAADLPGLGDSANAPEPHTPEGLAAILIEGLGRLVDPEDPIDLVGFSFGGVIGGHVAAGLGARLRRFVVVGSGGMGLPRAEMAPLKSWRSIEDAVAREMVHRDNLAILMFGDAVRIDPVALHLQKRNAEKGRVRSPVISRTDTLRRILPAITGRISGIWGEEDNIARGMLDSRRDVLREADPHSEFVIVPDAGHWVSYEAAPAFNAALARMLGTTLQQMADAGAAGGATQGRVP